jgi:hypothetical protein
MRLLHPHFAPRKARVRVLVVLALLTAGCAGPRASLDFGAISVPTKVQFGANAQAALVTPPLPPRGLAPPVFTTPTGNVLFTTGTVSSTPPAVPLGPCPPLSPLAVILAPAANNIAHPPVPATYHYRDDAAGTVNSHPVVFPKSSTETIQAVTTDTSSGTTTWKVVQKTGADTTTTSYQFVPATSLSQTAAGPQPMAGLYVTGVTTQAGKAKATSFNPAPPGLLLLETPAGPGNQWSTSGTDPTTGVTEAWTATQQGNKVVNACGQAIEAVTVHVDGSVSLSENGAQPQHVTTGQSIPNQVGTDTLESFVADYEIATQYGGLLVMDTVKYSGKQHGNQVDGHAKTTINELPKVPA